MNKNAIITLAIGLIIGVGGTLSVSALTNKDETTTEQQTSTDHSSTTMADMNKQLEKLSGDEFDKTFIEVMIAHHQGAIDMAKLSDTRVKHDEIKQLSKEIVTAQEKEINDMSQWQSEWGYTPSSAQMEHPTH